MLDDLLDVSRVAIRRLELQREPTLLANVLSVAIEQARPALDAAQQELVVDMPTDEVHAAVVSGDKARLVQVFANLLQNAAKYSSGPGQVHVGLHVEEGRAHVDVRDSGIGIDPRSLTSIFGLFVQEASEQRSQRSGLGIGLALVKGIVELHGGCVSACSEGPGTGSAFRVSLPVVEPIPVAAPRLDLPSATGATLAILVIDDNRDAADSLAALLRTFGHTVDVSYDGKTALNLYEARSPKVVLLDIGLPDVSGYDIAQHIRQAAGGDNVLLIAITGWAQADVKSAAAAAGFDHHLAKPVDIDALLQLLSAYPRGGRSDGVVEKLAQ
jgi:CheY-like chemotaxis protein